MIAFPSMLAAAAENAGMAFPAEPDNWQDFMEEFPHFYCFCRIQLGKSTRYHGEHWDNAVAIAAIPKDQLVNMSLEDFREAGVSL